jgi:hypothetical protein
MLPATLLLAALPALVVSACRDQLAPTEVTVPALAGPSAASSGTDGRSGLSAPSNLRVEAVSATRLEVSWNDNSSKEIGFEIHRSENGPGGTFTPSGSVGANVVTESDPAVNPSIPYCYKVRAFKLVSRRTTFYEFSGFSNIGCAPAGDLQVSSGTTGVDLDPTGYKLVLEAVTERGAVSVASANLATSGTITFPQLRAGDYYQVTLTDVASNCDLPSPQSASVPAGGTALLGFAVTCALLTPPVSPSALQVYSQVLSVSLVWNDDATNEDGFQIERCQPSELGCADADFIPIAQVPTADSRGLQSFVGYWDSDGLLSWTTYVYRVRAFNGAGYSGPSNEAEGTSFGMPCDEFGC